MSWQQKDIKEAQHTNYKSADIDARHSHLRNLELEFIYQPPLLLHHRSHAISQNLDAASLPRRSNRSAGLVIQASPKRGCNPCEELTCCFSLEFSSSSRELLSRSCWHSVSRLRSLSCSDSSLGLGIDSVVAAGGVESCVCPGSTSCVSIHGAGVGKLMQLAVLSVQPYE